MGIASLILGIISLVTGWIPFVCFIMLILAIIGLIFGIIDTLKKSKTQEANKGISIAGMVVSALAVSVIIISSIFSFVIMFIGMALSVDGYDCGYYEEYNNDYGICESENQLEEKNNPLEKYYNIFDNLDYYNHSNKM